MGRVLLLSDAHPDDPSGRAADFATRADLFAEHGWDVRVEYVPEPYVLTFVPSVWRCYWRARREDVDVINSVNNPFHLHVIGFIVALLGGIPWVAEVRDPMVENPDRDPAALTTHLARVVEWLVVRYADHVVWGDGIQMADDYFENTYPEADTDRFTKLPFRGFRREEFEGVAPVEYDTFTVTYAGSFYDEWIEPYAFFNGLARYVDDHAPDIVVQFYGDWRPDYDVAVEEAGLEEVVERHPFVPKAELVPVLKGSDALLYIGGTDPRNRLNVPSKIYDYVGARRPILAVVDPSFRVAELVRENDLGVVAPPGDPEKVSSAIDSVRHGSIYDPDKSVFERFDRERKIEILADVYGEAANGSATDKA